MKNRLLLHLILILSAAIGADAAERYELKMKDFSRLVVDDGINVEYKCSEDSAGYVTFTSTQRLADHLIFDDSKDGRLLIQKAFHGEGELSEGLPTVRVYSKFLNRVTNNGDSTVTIASVAACPEFKATIVGNGTLVVRDIHCNKFDGSIKTGNGTLVVSGVCDRATFNSTGVGNIQADGLRATDASCRFFGTGTTGVWVTDVLTVKGMFSGKLYYKGNPQKVKNYSMGVKLYRIDAEGNISEDTPREKSDDATESEK